MKSAHTLKKQLWEKRKWSEPTSDERSYTYPHHVLLNTDKPPLNELIFYDRMRFLVHNIMGDYLKRKKKGFFLSIFQVHAPLITEYLPVKKINNLDQYPLPTLITRCAAGSNRLQAVTPNYSTCISYNFFIFCPICLKFSHKFLHTYSFILSIIEKFDDFA